MIRASMREGDLAKAFLLLIMVPIACGTVSGLVMTIIVAGNFVNFGVSNHTVRTVALTFGGAAGLAISYLFFRQMGIQFIARKLLPAAPWPPYPTQTGGAEAATSMRVEYRVGVWDIVKFNVVQQFLSPLVGGICLGLVVFIFLCEVNGGNSLSAAAFTAALWFIGIWLFQALLITAFFYTGSADSVLTDHVLEIREGGLFESTPFSESLFFWPSVIKVVRRPGFVAVYISARQAHVIPTKAFESRERLVQFVARIREKKTHKS